MFDPMLDVIRVDEIAERNDDDQVLFAGTRERDNQRVSFHLQGEHASLMEQAIKRDGFCFAEIPNSDDGFGIKDGGTT